MTLLPHQQSPKVDLPYCNFQDLLKRKAELEPSREFLIFPETDRKFTYGEFYALSIAASEWMKARTGGIGTICILFRNTPEFLAAFFGAVAHGMTVVPINPDLATAHIYPPPLLYGFAAIPHAAGIYGHCHCNVVIVTRSIITVHPVRSSLWTVLNRCVIRPSPNALAPACDVHPSKGVNGTV